MSLHGGFLGQPPDALRQIAQQAESLNERDQLRQQKLDQITREEMSNFAQRGPNKVMVGKPSETFRQRMKEEMPDLPDEHLQPYVDAFDKAAPQALHNQQFKDVLAQEKTERYQNPASLRQLSLGLKEELKSKLPFVPSGTFEDWRLGRAQDRMREGTEDDADRRLIAQRMIANQDESEQGTARKIFETVGPIPGQLLELETAGGLAPKSLGLAGKIGAQGLGMTPRKFSQGMMPGVSLDEQGNPVVGEQKSVGKEAARAVAGGLVDSAIMHGVGQAGKVLRGVPEGATPGLLERAGVYGPVEGVVMGRAQEFVGGATGLRPDMGLVGELFSGDPERQKKALMEMGTEGAAFALVGGGEKLMGMRVRQLNSLGLSETEARQRAASEMKALRERFEQIKAQNADWMQQVLPGERQRIAEGIDSELGPVARTAGQGLAPWPETQPATPPPAAPERPPAPDVPTPPERSQGPYRPSTGLAVPQPPSTPSTGQRPTPSPEPSPAPFSHLTEAEVGQIAEQLLGKKLKTAKGLVEGLRKSGVSDEVIAQLGANQTTGGLGELPPGVQEVPLEPREGRPSPEARALIENKVRALGSEEAVRDFYQGSQGSKQYDYAVEFARQLFARPTTPSTSPQSTGLNPNVPAPRGNGKPTTPPATKEQATLHRQILGALGEDTAHEWDLHDAVNEARKEVGLGKVSDADFAATLQRLHAEGRLDGGDVTDEHHAALKEEADNLEASLRRAEARPTQEGRQPSREEQHALKEMREALDQLRAVQEAGPGRYWSRVPTEQKKGIDEAARAQIALGKAVQPPATMPEEQEQEEPWVGPGGRGSAPEGEIEQELRELLQRRKAIKEQRRAQPDELPSGSRVEAPLRRTDGQGVQGERAAAEDSVEGQAAARNGGSLPETPASRSEAAGGVVAPKSTGLNVPTGAGDLGGRELLEVRDEARRRLAFAQQEAERQKAQRRRLFGELRRFGNVMSEQRLEKLSERDRNAVKGLDDLAHSYAMNEPELFGSDGTEAADRIFEFLTTPKFQAPTFEELEARVRDEHLAERGDAHEPEGPLPEATEVAPGVLFHSTLRNAAKYEPVSREEAAEILRSGRPTPQLTPGQRTLLAEHLLSGKSLNQIARERGYSSANASMTFRIALRNLGAPATARTDPRSPFVAGTRSGETPKNIDELKALLQSDKPIAGLAPEEETILRARLGPEPRSGADVARELGVSRAAVSARFRTITRKLKIGGLTPEATGPEQAESREVNLPERGELTGRKSAGAYDVAPGFSYEKATEELSDTYMRRLSDKSNPITPEEKSWFASEISRLSQEEVSGSGRGPALQDAYQRHRQSEETPDVLYHTPGSTTAAGGAGQRGPGPFEVNATIDHLLDVANYNVKRIPQNKNASAATLMHEQAVLTKKLEAGNPEIRLEEAAHIIAGRLRLEVDPTKLPADVREGFKQNVNPALPPNLVTPRVMHEGFAQWMIRRAEGMSHVGTPQQLAAAQYAEQFVQQHGLGDALDRVGDVYRRHYSQSPAERYAGTIGNDMPGPVGRTWREKASGFLRGLADAGRRRIDNDLHDLGRMEDHAAQVGNKAPAPGRGPMETAQALRRSGETFANDWLEHGIPYLAPDGSLRPASKGFKEATARLKPGAEERMFNAYAKARNEVTEYQLEDAQIQAGQKVPRTVTKEQHDEAQRVLRDLRTNNPGQYQRFMETHQDLIDAANAGLRLLGQLGVSDHARVEELIKAHPDYTSRERVFDEMTGGELPVATGGRGGTPGFLKSRGLSGEMTRPALDTFRERYGKVARLAAKQMMDAPIRDMLRQPGMGKFGREMLEQRPDPNSADPNKTLPAEPDDPTKHIWKTRENGKVVRFMIADNSLFDYLRGEPLQKTASVKLAEALANIPVVNLVPKLIRLGAVAGSPYWHLRDMSPTREPLQFAQNSIDPKSLPTVYKWYQHWPEFLTMGRVREGAEAKPYVDLYSRLAGDTQLYLNQGEVNTQASTSKLADFLKETIRRLSYPEIVPRAVEMKNLLDAKGVDAATVERWNKDGSLPPVDLQVMLQNAAGEVTHAYARKGVDTRAWERVIPFLGAHVANTSKYVRNWKDNPGRMAGLLAATLAGRALYSWWKRDDQDHQETPVDQRGKYQFGPVALPGPRGPDAVFQGLADEAVRYSTGTSAHGSRIAHDLAEQAVPGGPEPYSTGLRLYTNRRQLLDSNNPIVPHGEPQEWMSKGTIQYRLPFAEQAVTGGFGGNLVRGAMEGDVNRALNPLYVAPHPHQSIHDFYEALGKAEEAERIRRRDQSRGLHVPAVPNHAKLKAAEKAMAELNKLLLREPGRKDEIMEKKIKLARQALGR